MSLKVEIDLSEYTSWEHFEEVIELTAENESLKEQLEIVRQEKSKLADMLLDFSPRYLRMECEVAGYKRQIENLN